VLPKIESIKFQPATNPVDAILDEPYTKSNKTWNFTTTLKVQNADKAALDSVKGNSNFYYEIGQIEWYVYKKDGATWNVCDYTNDGIVIANGTYSDTTVPDNSGEINKLNYIRFKENTPSGQYQIRGKLYGNLSVDGNYNVTDENNAYNFSIINVCQDNEGISYGYENADAAIRSESYPTEVIIGTSELGDGYTYSAAILGTTNNYDNCLILKPVTEGKYNKQKLTFNTEKTPAEIASFLKSVQTDDGCSVTVRMTITDASSKVRTYDKKVKLSGYFTVNYDLDGGSIDRSNSAFYEIPTASANLSRLELKNPTKSGLSFGGWYSGNTKVTKLCKEALGNITLKAKWLHTYSITYQLDGGSNHSLNPSSFNEETETIILKDPTKEGYTFLGWYDGTTKVTQIEKGTTGDKVLIAKWEKVETPVTPNPTTPANNYDIPQVTKEQATSFVSRMYNDALSRDAEQDGLNYWVNQLVEQKIDGAGLAKGFICSKEFSEKNLNNKEYVEVLYETFFGRSADADGLKHWVDALDSGKSRTEVLAGFVNSKEFSNACDESGIVRGTMEPDGSSVYNPGVNGFVNRLYKEALNRKGETEGVEYWSYGINKKQFSPEEAAKRFFLSEEYVKKNVSDEEYVETLYGTFMGRTSDAEGKAYWLNALKTGKTREEVLEGFSRSTEFSGIMAEFGL